MTSAEMTSAEMTSEICTDHHDLKDHGFSEMSIVKNKQTERKHRC